MLNQARASSSNVHDSFFAEVFRRGEIVADFLRCFLPQGLLDGIDVTRVRQVDQAFVESSLRYLLVDLARTDLEVMPLTWRTRGVLRVMCDIHSPRIAQDLAELLRSPEAISPSGGLDDLVVVVLYYAMRAATKLPMAQLEAILHEAVGERGGEAMATIASTLVRKARKEALKEGEEKGRQEGRQEGEVEALRRSCERLLLKRFGSVAAGRLAPLVRDVSSAAKLEEILDMLLSAETQEDVAQTLRRSTRSDS